MDMLAERTLYVDIVKRLNLGLVRTYLIRNVFWTTTQERSSIARLKAYFIDVDDNSIDVGSSLS